MTVTTCPQFNELDPEIMEDFAECLQENVEQIETCISLLDSSKDPELVHRLFRDIHSLKGNCRMVFLDPLVETIHNLEEIVSDMRQGNRSYCPFHGEFIVAIVIRINNMIRELIQHKQVEGDPQVTLLKAIEIVHESQNGQEEQALNSAMDILVGAKPEESNSEEPADPVKHSSSTPIVDEQNPDLAFFRKLALQLDDLGIYRKGRTDALLELCLSTNEDLNNLVDKDQLTAAVYLHDIGMSLVPPDILNKPSKLTPHEYETIKGHVDMGTQILKRVAGWEEAATMVNQHHEKYNGTGYPNGLSREEIHPGAMIIALADTFYAVTNERADRGYKKSLFSAVTMINGESGSQFHPDYVEAFNETVRHRYVARKEL